MIYSNCRSVTMLFLRRFGYRKFFCLQTVKECEGVKFSAKFDENLMKSQKKTIWLNTVFSISKTADSTFFENFHPKPRTTMLSCITLNSGLSRKCRKTLREKKPPTLRFSYFSHINKKLWLYYFSKNDIKLLCTRSG